MAEKVKRFHTARFYGRAHPDPRAEDKAVQAAIILLDAYPKSAMSPASLGVVSACQGDTVRAFEHFEKALEIEGQQEITPSSFNRTAGEWMDAMFLDKSERLLRIGALFFPEDGSLQTGLGLVSMMRARLYFEKAMRLDPDQQQARELLKRFDLR